MLLRVYWGAYNNSLTKQNKKIPWHSKQYFEQNQRWHVFGVEAPRCSLGLHCVSFSASVTLKHNNKQCWHSRSAPHPSTHGIHFHRVALSYNLYTHFQRTGRVRVCLEWTSVYIVQCKDPYDTLVNPNQMLAAVAQPDCKCNDRLLWDILISFLKSANKI